VVGTEIPKLRKAARVPSPRNRPAPTVTRVPKVPRGRRATAVKATSLVRVVNQVTTAWILIGLDMMMEQIARGTRTRVYLIILMILVVQGTVMTKMRTV